MTGAGRFLKLENDETFRGGLEAEEVELEEVVEGWLPILVR